MKAIIFRVSDHFANSMTNYCVFDTCLVLATQNGKKIETVAWSPYFSELMFLQGKDLCFCTCRQVIYEMFVVWI